jgi:hypothetical protein
MNLISITGGGNSSSPPKINTMLGMENTTVFLAKLALTPGKLSTPIIKIPPKMRTDMWCCCGREKIDFYFFLKSYKLQMIKPT